MTHHTDVDLSEFRALLSATGQQALEQATALQPAEADFLGHFSTLSRIYPPEIARPALETAILRREAAVKFPFASVMYFDRPALEQASNYEVSAYRAGRFAGFGPRLDLGCSVGGDSLALAARTQVIGFDLDPLRLAMARANLSAVLSDARVDFILADLERPLPLQLSPGQAAFFDPARRSAERRIHSVHQYRPPLDVIRDWLLKIPAIGVKISPGVDLSELKGYQAEVEFISLRGELKEAVLWFGPLRTTGRRATLLPGPHTLIANSGQAGLNASQAEGKVKFPLSEPLAYLYEPDPAVLRAGLVRTLGEQLGAAQLDPDIAYLTAEGWVETPFATAYPIEEWLPFSLKRLRFALRRRKAESVVVKKRGSPISPEALLRGLHLKPGSGGSPDERIVFLTHLRGKPIAVICKPPV